MKAHLAAYCLKRVSGWCVAVFEERVSQNRLCSASRRSIPASSQADAERIANKMHTCGEVQSVFLMG